MTRPTSLSRVRLTVESLDSRELPSVSLSAFHATLFRSIPGQKRFIPTTPAPPLFPGSTSPDPGTCSIIGIWIALYL
jgi:hypothetical protein